MRAEARTDEVIARLAARAHGVVTRQGLMAAGVGRGEIESRVAKGALIRVHRGVFRVGHAAPSVLASYTAAVLACGEGAALAGLAAAHLHRMLKHPPALPSVLTATERVVPGVQTHRCRKRLIEEEMTMARGIAVTSVARTLVDLAPLLSRGDLARAFHRAQHHSGLHPVAVEMVLERHPKVPGAATVRRVARGDDPIELSHLETGFRQLLRRERLPLPVMNRPAGGHLLDCRWPDHGVTVELDSYTFHNSLHAWDGDRAREREAYDRGDEFRRFTRVDVFDDQRVMLRVLRHLLS